MNEHIFNKLKSFFPTEKDLQEFQNTPRDDLYMYHFGFGSWIRNNILYEKTDFLKQCEEIGINADDLSSDMIVNFYIKLKCLDKQ